MSILSKLHSLFLFSLLVNCFFITSHSAADDTDEYVTIAELESAIQLAMKKSIEENNTEPYFLIEKVEVTMVGEKDASVAGGFRIPVFGAEISSKVIRQSTSSDEFKHIYEPEAIATGNKKIKISPVSYTHLTLPTIYSV